MLEQLKKQSRKSTRNRLIICLLITIISLLVVSGSLSKLISGPEKLDDLPLDRISAAYVNADINAILGNFAEYYEESDDGSKNVTDNYYVIPVGDEEFIGLQVSKEDFDSAELIFNQTMDYLIGNTDELTSIMNVTGSVNDMDSEVYDYYKEWFEEYGYTDEEIDNVALPYILQIGYIGAMDQVAVYGLLALAAVGLLLTVIIIIQSLTGSYLSRIKKYIRENESSASMERIESDFENAAALGSVWVGKLFTYYFQGNKAWILKNSDIVWAYLLNVTHKTYGIKVGTTKTLLIYTRDKKKHSVQVKKSDDITAILQQLSETNPYVVTGYSDELMKLFKKDFDAFTNLRYSKESTDTKWQEQSDRQDTSF